MKHTLRNQHLILSVKEHGAELCSLKYHQESGLHIYHPADFVSNRPAGEMPTTELLWQGDPQYWDGQSPVLFPTVGRVFDDTIRCQGKTYPMPKHGLVRNMDFQLTKLNQDTLSLTTCSTEQTLQHFPYPFRLTVSYQLIGKQVKVTFAVENPSDTPMPFHLGAHPALNLPDFDEQDELHGYLGFDVRDELVSNGLKPGGYLWPEGSFSVPLDKLGLLPLTNTTFQCDTILDSRALAHACTLYNKRKEPILRVNFDSPILALWAPNDGCAPFVCIEPWWGCCDEADYKGEFAQRPWTNIVQPRQTKTISYSITLI